MYIYVSVLSRLAAKKRGYRERKRMQSNRDDQGSSSSSSSSSESCDDNDDGQLSLTSAAAADRHHDGFIGFEGRDGDRLYLARSLEINCKINEGVGGQSPYRSLPHCYYNPLFSPELKSTLDQQSLIVQMHRRAGRKMVGLKEV